MSPFEGGGRGLFRPGRALEHEASRDRVRYLATEVQTILEAALCSDMAVTDETPMIDLAVAPYITGPEEYAAFLAEMRRCLRVPVLPDDLVIEVAQRLRDKSV